MSKWDRNNRYYAKHRERILATNKATYWADPEASRAAQRLYKREHPERVAFHTTKHSASRIDAEFNLSIEDFMEAWDGDVSRRGRMLDNLCLYRYGDAGAYELGNVYVATLSEHNAGART